MHRGAERGTMTRNDKEDSGGPPALGIALDLPTTASSYNGNMQEQPQTSTTNRLYAQLYRTAQSACTANRRHPTDTTAMLVGFVGRVERFESVAATSLAFAPTDR